MGLVSGVLGLELWAKVNDDVEVPYVLRLYDPVSEAWLPTPAWSEAERRAAEARAAREAEARRAAEARIAELEAELTRLRR